MDKRILAIIVAAIVLVAGVGAYIALNNGHGGSAHPSASAFPEAVSEESRVLPTDLTTLRTESQTLIDTLSTAIESGTADEMNAAAQAAGDRLTEMRDWLSWATVYYYISPSTEATAFASWTELAQWYDDSLETLLHNALSGDRADLVETAIGYTDLKVSDIRNYIPLGETALQLKAQDTQLTTQYQTIMATEYTYSYNGTSWTVSTAQSSATLTDTEKATIIGAIYTEQLTAAATVYVQLVEVRNDFAQELGLGNYLDYAYNNTFYRGYTYQDVQETLQVTLTTGSTYQSLITAISTDERFLASSLSSLTEKGTDWMYSTIGSFMGSIDGTMGEFMTYMVDQNLINYAQNGINGAFTTPLVKAHSAVLYIGSSDIETFRTLVHELGHAADAALSPLANNMCYDIAETQSQALEALMCVKASEYIGDLSSNFTALVFANFANTLYMGSAVAELEIWAYTTEASGTKLTVDSLNDHFRSTLDADYPLTTVFDTGLYWAQVGHMFASPGYYVSYVTSVLNSLEIFMTANEDLDKGIDLYLSVLYQGVDDGYVNTITSCGLSNMLETDNASKIVEYFKTYVAQMLASS